MNTKPKHDPFFSRSLEIPEIAHDFFKYHLSLDLSQQLDLSNMARLDRTNTDFNLKQRERDIVYKTKLNKINTAFLCVEHQSYFQRNMPLRLIKYYLDTVETYLNAGNIKWPLVISIVFYHGQTAPYPHSGEVTAYYEDPILGSQQLTFRFYIIDITQISDEVILTHELCAPVELLLKHGRDAKFELPIEAYRKVFHDCIAVVGGHYIYSMLEYAKNLGDLEIGEKIYKFIEQIFTDKQDLIMTYGQKLEKMGEQRGMVIGMQEEKLALAKVMLQDSEPIEKIMQWTGLSRQTIENIEQDLELAY
jgi:predicted transposase YdaD